LTGVSVTGTSPLSLGVLLSKTKSHLGRGKVDFISADSRKEFHPAVELTFIFFEAQREAGVSLNQTVFGRGKAIA
jgi:hypothetical protein